jgi:peroxiredoxin
MKLLSLPACLLATGSLLTGGALLAQPGDFSLTLKWPGPEGVKKIFIDYRSGNGYRRDSVSVKAGGGTVSYTGRLTETDLSRVTLSTGSGSRTEKNSLTLFIGGKDRLSIDVSSTLSSATISGSPASSGYRGLLADLAAAGKDRATRLSLLEKYIMAHPDSPVGFRAMQRQMEFNLTNDSSLADLQALEHVFSQLSARVRVLPDEKEYAGKLSRLQHLMVGAIAPDFSSTTIEDQPVKLSQYRGKYVLLDFWASWCIPCRKEFPFLKKAYAGYKDKNFEIVGYSIDNDRSLWESAVNNDDVSWLQVSGLIGYSDPVAVLYQINGVPSNWLIDPSGRIIARNLRGEEVEKRLAQLIK